MQVTLIPKLQVQFAEFLQHHSLIRLSILYPPTSVGLRYGLSLQQGQSKCYFLEPIANKRQSNKPLISFLTRHIYEVQEY